jgi:hypothetical protein
MKMTKKTTYKDKTYEIEVELNSIVERRISGEKTHTITVKGLHGFVYNRKTMVQDNLLEAGIVLIEKDMRTYINELLNPEQGDIRLLNMGFV